MKLWVIHCGDALEVLRTLPDGSAHCCVTSPPYWGLRDYGIKGQVGLERTPEEYVAKLVDVFREVRRVLRDDGTLWLVLGDCYATGAGKVGECPGGGEQGARWRGDGSKHDYGLGPLTQPNRMPIDGLKPKDLVGIPWRVAFALQADRWWLRSDIIWQKMNAMPESVTDRPTKAHEYIFLLSKAAKYYYDADAIREEHSPESLARYEYGLHTSAPQDGKIAASGCSEGNIRALGRSNRMGDNINYLGRNKRSVWTAPTRGFPAAHFATFPPALIEPCILAGCPIGGTVLDPFAGAGTTGLVALRNGRGFIGIELNPEYVEMAKRRITDDAPLFNNRELAK